MKITYNVVVTVTLSFDVSASTPTEVLAEESIYFPGNFFIPTYFTPGYFI